MFIKCIDKYGGVFRENFPRGKSPLGNLTGGNFPRGSSPSTEKIKGYLRYKSSFCHKVALDE